MKRVYAVLKEKAVRQKHIRKTTRSRKPLALLAALVVTASGTLRAAEPVPLPPPPELTDGNGFSIGAPAPQPYAAQPYAPPPYVAPLAPQNPYNNYGQPRPELPESDPYNTMPQLPPLPGQPASQTADSYTVRNPISVPNMAPPPMASAPYSPVPVQGGQGFRVSGPAQTMPEEYFNLPLTDEDYIPGVMLPDLDPEFSDPGAPAYTGKRYVEPGMNQRQLEPFFELAKGFEKRALDFRKNNDEANYRDSLGRAVGGYMEIIAMADASNEAREEAWYGVARCEYRRENYWRAFDALERSFPEQYERSEVEGRIRLEMFIGERLWRMGANQVPDSRKNEAPMNGYQAANRVYTAALFNQPNAADAPLAMLRRGDAMAMEENWEEAAKFYRSAIEYYPESEPAMQARSSLTEAVYRQEWPAGFPEAARSDLARVMDDVERNDSLLSAPAEERRRRAVALANSLEAENLLRTAKSYMSQIRLQKSRDAAVFQLGEIVSRYPNTEQASEAADLLRGMGIEPPMRLSEGDRFPITPHWEPEDMPARGQAVLGESGGGNGPRERQDREAPRTEQRRPEPRPEPRVDPRVEQREVPRAETPPEPAPGGFSPVREPDPVEPYLPGGQPGFSADEVNGR
jgi:tetratricopeptide (TPR) repeat protein